MSEPVDIAWPDIEGRLHHVTVAADDATGVIDSVGLTGDDLGWDGLTDVIHPLPDRSALMSPWNAGRQVRLCRLVDDEGAPAPACSRSTLLRATDRAAAAGGRPIMAAEVEFVLRNGDDGEPVYPHIENYGIVAGAPYEKVMRAVRSLSFGETRVTASNPEYGPGQFEINLSHGPALSAADAVSLLRSHVEELSRGHGLVADFAAKPREDLSGNGLHVHQSLWAEDGSNRFWSDGLSADAMAYLGGLLGSLVDLAAIGSPTEDAYRRREVGSFCPTVVSWGGDNRTVAVRALDESEGATRLEQRDAAADANPYLTFAGQIQAGLDGVESGADPGERTTGNAYVRDDLPRIPVGLGEALRSLERSELAVRVLGAEAHGSFCRALAGRVRMVNA